MKVKVARSNGKIGKISEHGFSKTTISLKNQKESIFERETEQLRISVLA
jgi:hypothetical protein